MKLINPSVEILHVTVGFINIVNGEQVLQFIEKIGKVCYKSEDKITPDSARRFIKQILRSGHESVIEHFSITVKVITDRGISHEIVRHRIASYSQESTRYVCYAKDKFDNQITVVEPGLYDPQEKYGGESHQLWKASCEKAEGCYLRMIKLGISPQIARSVLPTCLKTELVMTMNLREWRHFLKLRTSSRAHPGIRKVAFMILNKFQVWIPLIFDDI